jgi:hypothetical protein
MRRTLIMLAFVAGLVAACGSSAATAGVPIGDLPAVNEPAGPTQASAPAVATPAAGSVASGNPAGGDPATPVACTLITATDATTALGEPVAAGKNPGLGENVCIFSGQPSYGVNFVELRVVDPSEFLPDRAPVAGVFDRIPVSGVGDAAYYQKDYLPNNSGTTMTLWFKKGATVIAVYVVHPGAPDAQLESAEKTLALAAIGRM